MANERRSNSDDYENEPVMGYSERQLGPLGRPLPKQPDHFETIMTMLTALPKIVPQTGPNMAHVVAAQGRGGDTAIAHLTPGEMVIPQRLQTPEVIAALKRAVGGSLARYQVGHPANRVNPRTGAPEFDDDEDDAAVTGPIQSSSDQTANAAPNPVDGTPAPAAQPPLHPFPKLHEYLPEAAAVYGETASLRPQLIDPDKSSQDPSNWDPDSTAKLAQGRADIAALYARNQHMRRAQPTDFSNPIQMREWNSALEAAAKAPQTNLDPSIDRLYIRQEGKPLPNAPDYTTIVPSVGPFRKRGAGDVPSGDNTYLDLYSDQPPKVRISNKPTS